jgi:hypothetical protein
VISLNFKPLAYKMPFAWLRSYNLRIKGDFMHDKLVKLRLLLPKQELEKDEPQQTSPTEPQIDPEIQKQQLHKLKKLRSHVRLALEHKHVYVYDNSRRRGAMGLPQH